MRILHTSDWHLGQSFYGKSRASEHQAFLDWLLAQIRQFDVDVLLVVGDIFDTGTPPSYARTLYNRFVVDVQATGCRLVILGGNHDSVATLNESRELLACLNTQVVAGPAAAPDRVLLLKDRQGEPGALLCAVPYLRARDLLLSAAGESALDKQQALQQALADTYHSLHQLAQVQQAAHLERTGRKLPILATGHLTLVGASRSESVRDLYIGTLDALPLSVLPEFDYLALGHIHRPQHVGGLATVRYCGAPLAMSFDELEQSKQVLLLNWDDAQPPEITPLLVPCWQPMARLSGSVESLCNQMTDLSVPAGQPLWLDLEVTHQGYLGDLQARIEQVSAALPVEVLLLRRVREQSSVWQGEPTETLSELTPHEVFARRLAQEESLTGEAQDARRQRLIDHFNLVLTELEDPAQEASA
ncbi:exonuclease subunit SbcD [Pseudaeromonas paramecii]|uniref:Nuclease SbcCD subunit D n=1 Tax=Pseudaeromonas paramecii TaxID=2138166 RepID=A0ABP8QGJ4_9GAMM